MSVQKKLLLFLGAPGSGKGTLAQRCVKELDYEQLSTGNLFREHVAQHSEIGKSIDLALKSGKLIDDRVVTSMVTGWLNQNPSKARIILDGYPRTIIQAKTFDDFIVSESDKKPPIIWLKISEQCVIDRLTLRLTCSQKGCQVVYSLAKDSGCQPRKADVCDLCESALIRRSDDEVDAIKKRLKLYSVHEQQLLDFYNDHGYDIVDLNAGQPAASIFDEFKRRVYE